MSRFCWEVAIWHTSDGSWRVRIVDENFHSLVAPQLLVHDDYWREVVEGLRPVYVLPGSGSVNKDGVRLVQSIRTALGVPVRTVRSYVWLAGDGSIERRAGSLAGLGMLAGKASRMVSGGWGSSQIGYAGHAYSDPLGSAG